jgi:hypothetical protein
MKIEFKRFGLMALMLASTTFMTSCLNTEDDSTPYTPAGGVTFNNFSPGNDGLKFLSGGETTHNGTLDYGQNIGFWTANAGIHTFTVNSGSTPLDTLNVTIAPDRYYSLFAVNTPENTELISVEEQFIIPETGKAAIRFFNLSPDAPSLKVSLANEPTDLGTYFFKQSSNYMQVNEAFNKRMYLIDHANNDTIFSKQVNFSNGKLYQVVAKGLVNTTDDTKKINIQVTAFQF